MKPKNLLVWAIVFILFIAAFNAMNDSAKNQDIGEIIFSDFLGEVDEGMIRSVHIEGNDITGFYQDGVTQFATYKPEYPNLIERLTAAGVSVEAAPIDDSGNTFWAIFMSWGPIILLIAVWIFLLKQMQGGGKGGGSGLGFGRSKARLLTGTQDRKTFDDVAGIDEAQEELEEIVDFLKQPAKYHKLGGKIPRGCLLIGPPGTGKTLLARAIAGEAGVPFFRISGSDFVEMFVGVGASRVRSMFEQGKKHAPCIIFIDEIDAVGRSRGVGYGGGNDEREQTLNQLLVEMDGFDPNDSVIIIAATNRPDVLDKALLRPGRFDRQIVVNNPDVYGRAKILAVHLRTVQTAPDVDPHIIARGTPGFSGADLANVVNESALLAARNDKKVVTMDDMEKAKDKVMMGVERKSLVVSEEERKLTAYHEAGHAIVGLNVAGSDPIHKATIVPRGQSLGMVMRLPEKDRLSLTRQKAKADIAVAMGGRVAEEMIFGYDMVTSGASSDIKMATKMADSMVLEWGMSDLIGPLLQSSDDSSGYMPKSSFYSDDRGKLLDKEIKALIDEGYQKAKDILT